MKSRAASFVTCNKQTNVFSLLLFVRMTIDSIQKADIKIALFVILPHVSSLRNNYNPLREHFFARCVIECTKQEALSIEEQSIN